MSDASTRPSKTPATNNKRRSILADLGIKPGGAAPTTVTPSQKERGNNGISNKSSQPKTTSLSRQSSTKQSSTGPAPVRATSLNRRPSSPASPTTTPRKVSSTSQRPTSVHGVANVTPVSSTKRRPASTSLQQISPRPTSSPMSRRASLNPPASPRSATPNRTSFSAESEIKLLKDDVAQKVAKMEEQEILIKELQNKLACHQDGDRQDEMKKAMDQINVLQQKVDDSQASLQRQKEEFEEEKQSLKTQLEIARKERVDDMMEEQKRRTQEEMESLLVKHQSELEKLTLTHEKEMTGLKTEWEANQSKIQEEHATLLEQYEKLKLDDDSLSQKYNSLIQQHQEMTHQRDELEKRLTEMETMLSTSKDCLYVRELEQRLNSARHATEALERRFRDEMKQSQNDHDDTAQTWLEKHQRSQFELDQLQQLLTETKEQHAQEMIMLKEQSIAQQEEMEARLAQVNEDHDHQAQHIDVLENQIEELQTKLEEATLRLEQHAATLKPSLSNQEYQQQQQYSTSTNATTVINNMIPQQEDSDLMDLHAECQTKYMDLQQQLERVQQELSIAKDTQSHQLALDKQQAESDEKLILVAQQHKKEVQLLYDQYQQLVDLKDHELEAYAYRVKSLNVARLKELESCRVEASDRINHLEHQIEGYEITIRSNNEKLMTLQSQLDTLEQQKKQDQHAIQILTRERGSLRDENDQLIQLVNQLQSQLK
ncbi:uncharacterized protein BX664DRAFT_336771 [Halteromyces radiatus]|uniref:uncharacterized protein n=1 Tax=Halteromyces radiatus TaxID=101107 RepID=UPI00221FD702|nr:uncharacterized protein BX664DRAFT_336771 [Halteromyces radiatus]KAI8086789.1 hypothetical protein BX664DRAFT_336771 [Halteromyces radiatus]